MKLADLLANITYAQINV